MSNHIVNPPQSQMCHKCVTPSHCHTSRLFEESPCQVPPLHVSVPHVDITSLQHPWSGCTSCMHCNFLEPSQCPSHHRVTYCHTRGHMSPVTHAPVCIVSPGTLPRTAPITTECRMPCSLIATCTAVCIPTLWMRAHALAHHQPLISILYR